jgi:hypothetical protein
MTSDRRIDSALQRYVIASAEWERALRAMDRAETVMLDSEDEATAAIQSGIERVSLLDGSVYSVSIHESGIAVERAEIQGTKA